MDNYLDVSSGALIDKCEVEGRDTHNKLQTNDSLEIFYLSIVDLRSPI